MAGERHPDGEITVEARDHVLLIGIDRREKRNSLTPRMTGLLQDAMERLDTDPDLRVGVIFGHAGHFTAGLDLPRFVEMKRRGEDHLDPSRVDPFGRWSRVRKPVVTAVCGITFTAGIELMLAGDIVIAADDCRFAQIEAKRGIIPTGGAIQRFIGRAGWGNAMALLLACQEFDAPTALRFGLVQEVVPAGRELDRALELTTLIAANAPLAIQATIEAGLTHLAHDDPATTERIERLSRALIETEDAREGVRAFSERRAPRFTGR
ncbi:MAG: crotonase/enoyl-CoA hydratase family protein [Sagittula sp.]|uniref:crotonase/enoyl-CoA hydratase family protein n=1 Tax=Sagittula sp. TaxID=2038081 RepID=UPI004058D9EE